MAKKKVTEENISDDSSVSENLNAENEAQVEIKQETKEIEPSGFIAVYSRTVGWSKSWKFQGTLERKYRTVSIVIPANDIERIERYKKLCEKYPLPTEKQMRDARII